MELVAFAEEVGSEDPVVPVGGRTQWDVGGPPDGSAREVRAPAGIVTHEPEELIVRVRAGTPVSELDAALAAAGQMASIDALTPDAATVGGALAVGHSGVRRLRWGPIRDLVLEARYVSAEGRLVKAGAPVVKNVTGFDLCRLLVGSLGTLGILAEVVLRCVPVPASRRWLVGEGADPFATLDLLYRPSSVLWDGRRTWVLLEGLAEDVASQAALLDGFVQAEGPPPIPTAGRLSLRPRQLRSLTGEGFLAQVGVGVVHLAESDLAEAIRGGVRPLLPPNALHAAVKAQFDPTGRLNPGRSVVMSERSERPDKHSASASHAPTKEVHK